MKGRKAFMVAVAIMVLTGATSVLADAGTHTAMEVVPTATINGGDGTYTSGAGIYSPRSTQCVLFDTRPGQGGTGALTFGSTRTFAISGDLTTQGGDSGCSVAGSAVAYHINVVAIDATSGGNLKIWPATQSEPNGGIVNYQALSPAMNNSNAFDIDYDASGLKVKANQTAGSVHVRGILYGTFLDGGSYFAASYHDHGVVQAVGNLGSVSSTTYATVRSVGATFADECSFIFTEKHNALVTFSGYVQTTGTGNLAANLQLDVDGTAKTESFTQLEVGSSPGFLQTTEVPFSKTYLMTDLGSGAHTFNVQARKEGAGDLTFSVDADIQVLHLGWACSFIIFPLP